MTLNHNQQQQLNILFCILLCCKISITAVIVRVNSERHQCTYYPDFSDLLLYDATIFGHVKVSMKLLFRRKLHNYTVHPPLSTQA